MELHAYDKYIISFSGGKDSLALLLYLLKSGIDKSKIEIWHCEIDGREGSTLMDWAFTVSYVTAIAKAFNIPIYFCWREGGFEREMLRENSLTGGVYFETPDQGLVYKPAKDIERFYNTRNKFPQISADLSVRWCSSYIKIDVFDIAIRNQPRFNGIKTLVLTGERAEESAARARYNEFEPHRADLRNGKIRQRWIDHFRAVLYWTEAQVWKIIEEFNVNPAIAYHLGIGRFSCMFCIFGSANQLALAKFIAPLRFAVIAEYEKRFKITIKRNEPIEAFVERGIVDQNIDSALLEAARSTEYNQPIFLKPGEWKLPKGAFSKETCGAL